MFFLRQCGGGSARAQAHVQFSGRDLRPTLYTVPRLIKPPNESDRLVLYECSIKLLVKFTICKEGETSGLKYFSWRKIVGHSKTYFHPRSLFLDVFIYIIYVCMYVLGYIIV